MICSILGSPRCFCPYLWSDRSLRAINGGQVVSILYVITGTITLVLFVYLVLALLKPEWFG